MDNTNAILARVRYLYEELFHRNQLEMAKAMEVSPAAISKVLSAQRNPGRKLLAALAKQSNVNPEWLYSGAGDPFHEPLKKYLDRLPIFRQIPAHDWLGQEELSFANRTVLPGIYTKGCYFLEAQAEMPLVRNSGLSILHGDLLLMKPLKVHPLRDNALDGHIAAVKSANAKTHEIEMRLGLLDWHDDEDGSYFEFDDWSQTMPAESSNTIAVTIEIWDRKIVGTECHPVTRQTSGSTTSRKAAIVPMNPTVKKQNVIAYCEQLVRVFS